MRLAIWSLLNEDFEIGNSINVSLLLLVGIAAAEESLSVVLIEVLNDEGCIADYTRLLVQMVECQAAIRVDLRDLKFDAFVSHGPADILKEANTLGEVLDSLLV